MRGEGQEKSRERVGREGSQEGRKEGRIKASCQTSRTPPPVTVNKKAKRALSKKTHIPTTPSPSDGCTETTITCNGLHLALNDLVCLVGLPLLQKLANTCNDLETLIQRVLDLLANQLNSSSSSNNKCSKSVHAGNRERKKGK